MSSTVTEDGEYRDTVSLYTLWATVYTMSIFYIHSLYSPSSVTVDDIKNKEKIRSLWGIKAPS